MKTNIYSMLIGFVLGTVFYMLQVDKYPEDTIDLYIYWIAFIALFRAFATKGVFK